jgi:hypothetical protein
MISLIAHSNQSSIVGWSGHVVDPSFADTANMPDGNGKISIVLVSMLPLLVMPAQRRARFG